jgi:hypothetical protein
MLRKPLDPAILPIHQFVNWIRYSSYTPGAGPGGSDFTSQWEDNFNTLDSARWGMASWTFGGNRVDFAPENVNVQNGMLILSLTQENQTGFSGTVPTDTSAGPSRITDKRAAPISINWLRNFDLLGRLNHP